MLTPEVLQKRAALIQGLRAFFIDRDYLEVDTPVRVPVIAPETYIEPELSGDFFLQTSPELCMKRLLAAGAERIFQICRCFRRSERGRLHLPEFTMLEWYRTGTDYAGLMDECEDLLRSLSGSCDIDRVERNGGLISFESPWERMTVADAFRSYGGISVEKALANDSFEEILVSRIEPHLGFTKPVFLYDYPVELGALARVQKGNPQVAERFELYVGGIELANGFSELIDPEEQRSRFLADRARIKEQGRDPGPMPERFLDDLSNMPPAAGIALGVDRLIMLFLGAESIDDAVTFIPEEL